MRKYFNEKNIDLEFILLSPYLSEQLISDGSGLSFCKVEIEACRPYFVQILGLKYDYVPFYLPDDLIDNDPWCVAHKNNFVGQGVGYSVSEFEFVNSSVIPSKNYAVGRAPLSAIIYIRHPSYKPRSEYLIANSSERNHSNYPYPNTTVHVYPKSSISIKYEEENKNTNMHININEGGERRCNELPTRESVNALKELITLIRSTSGAKLDSNYANNLDLLTKMEYDIKKWADRDFKMFTSPTVIDLYSFKLQIGLSLSLSRPPSHSFLSLSVFYIRCSHLSHTHIYTYT